MPRSLSVTRESFPIAGVFAISRGSKTAADVLCCEIREGDAVGRGECVPYGRYGETPDSVAAQISAVSDAIAGGVSRDELLIAMPAGAARNAVDCALWDLEARLSGIPAWKTATLRAPRSIVTAYTISLGAPQAMAEAARAASHRPLIKVKVGGGGDDRARMQAVAAAAPQSQFIIDANEGWTDADIEANLEIAARCRAVLVEQPLPAGGDAILGRIDRPVPVCADESIHTDGDIAGLAGLYDAVNIKLDKAGGLTAALRLREQARALDFRIMVGCMVGTSLAMAPAVLLAQDAEFADLDGPLLLARDREPGLRYEGSLVHPPERGVWG